MKSAITGGQQIERLSFLIMILFILCHFIGCLWIFIANTAGDDAQEDDTWLKAGGYADFGMFDKYAVSAYFVMQTITTVGYGDIAIRTTLERSICIVLELVGVIFFSFASGSLTSIIANYDNADTKNQEKVSVLNRILKEFNIPSELYYQLLTQIQSQDDQKTLRETNAFLEQLPFRLKIRTIMYLYKESYETVVYLKN